jgi:hypothetical protein
MGKMLATASALIFAALVVYTMLVIAGFARNPQQARQIRQVKSAIRIAEAACQSRNTALLNDAVANAKDAISQLSWQDRMKETAALGNRLAELGCSMD